MNNKKIYYAGSTICIISSQLFLLASLYNLFYCKKFIESLIILTLYYTSILYHYDGNKYMRYIDILVTRITIIICIIISILKKNILPIIFTLFVAIFYYIKLSSHPLYHSLTVHLPGFIGFITLYYNN
jgi:hypothetical protein